MSSTTKLKSQKEIVGFHFQEIPLEEAVNAVIAGDGNYAVVKAKLLEALPLLPVGKAFAFGLPNGKEVEEDQRRGVCMALNMTLKKAKLPWRVTYSGIKKLFVCVPPATPRNYKSKESINGYTPRSKWNDLDNNAILDLWKKGANVREIEEQTGEDIQRIKYVCYQQNPRKPRPVPTNPGQGKMDDTKAMREMEAMILQAQRIFKVTPEQIQKGLGRGKVVRKAICVVACGMTIAPRIVAPFVGISKGGVKFNSRQNTSFAKAEIAKLREFYRG